MENINNDQKMVSVEVCQSNAALKIETKNHKKSKVSVEPIWFVIYFFHRSCTGRDSGFNSEIPSCECGIGSRGILPSFPVNSGIGYPVNSGIGFPINSGIVFPEQPSQNDLDFPSALLVSDLNSGILAQYGLNGPLDEYPGEEDEGDADDLEVGGADDLLGMPPMPSAVTSVTTKRKRHIVP